MFTSEIQPKNKLLIAGVGLLFFAMAFPSFFLLAKIAIGLIMTAIAIIAVKISSKAISNVLEEKKADQNQATQNKPMNLFTGLASIFVGGLSLLIIAQTGLISACVAVAALALYKNEEIGKYIDNKLDLDKVANNTTEFIVSGIEKLIPSQSREAQ